VIKFRLKILFIGHDASLTGAPVLLLNLLQVLSERDDVESKVILVKGGALKSKYEELFHAEILKSIDYGNETSFFRRIGNYLRYQKKVIELRKASRQFDLVFSNTIANGRLLKKAFANHKIITYVHELSSVIQYFDRLGDSTFSLKLSSAFAVPSSAVSINLKNNFNIPENRLFKLSYYFPSPQLKRTKSEARKLFLKEHGLNEATFLVVGMGVATKRKGFDIFKDVASKFIQDSNIRFVWIGDFIEDESRQELPGLPNNLILTGFLPHNPENLLPFDVFLLTSREDPYPLVVLEAANVKLPSICFSKTGGITDFIDENTGWVVDGISVEKTIEVLKLLQGSPDEIEKKGNAAYEKFKSIHCNANLINQQFDELVQKVME